MKKVYRRMNTHKTLLIDIVHRQLSFLGQLIRKYDWECFVVTWIVDGK